MTIQPGATAEEIIDWVQQTLTHSEDSDACLNSIDEAIERWRAEQQECGDERAAAGAYAAETEGLEVLAEQNAESLRIAQDRVRDLEGGFDAISVCFQEPYYSWQQTLHMVRQLIHRRDACAEACLNAIGVFAGQSVLSAEAVRHKLIAAVSPLVRREESPEFSRVHDSAGLLRSYQAKCGKGGA